MIRPIAILLFVFLALPASALPCSLCGPQLKEQNSLGEELDRAKLVMFGKLVASAPDPTARGLGRSQFQIDRILRDDPFLKDKKYLVLERYVPVLNPKDPPRFLVFCDVVKDRLDPYLGRTVKSDAVIDYLLGAADLRGKKDLASRMRALQYYFKFFDHADETVAGDAFREFAKASDQEIAAVARTLAPERLRALFEKPGTNPDFLGLLGFLLGNCGQERDAGFLRTQAIRAADASQSSFDGLLAGFIALKPREGWELLRSYVADPKKSFPVRYSAICTLRFCYSVKPREYRQETLRCLDTLVVDGDVADMAIEDLRKWQLWELTPNVLAQFGKKSHNAPITRRTIVRYALCCPTAEARQFVQRVRGADAELVREIESGLNLERNIDN